MARVKFTKNKAYHKRFQTKWRRRREGKTDYQARRALVTQDKRKYNSPRYRLVVRFTKKHYRHHGEVILREILAFARGMSPSYQIRNTSKAQIVYPTPCQGVTPRVPFDANALDLIVRLCKPDGDRVVGALQFNRSRLTVSRLFLSAFRNLLIRDIICQVVAARLAGDEVLTAAYAHELPRYGIKHGLTNFAAAYCVGLLCARRHLTKLGLHETYKGVEEVDGEMFEIEEDEDKRPFTALLDIGLVRTSTGNKVFSVMKGAVDGGMNIPHNEKRFPAYTKEEGFDPEELKSRILGNHVSEYMSYLLEEDEDRYQKQFAAYIRDGIDADAIEDLYLEAHQKIREDPSFSKKEKSTAEHNASWRLKKRTYEERKQAIKDKIAAHLAAAAAADE